MSLIILQCTKLWIWLRSIILFHCSVIIHSFQWKELALVMRNGLPFLIIDANSPIDGKLHKRCPRFGWIPFCPGHTQCKPYEGFKMYIAGEMWQNLKHFLRNACYQNNERELCYIIKPIQRQIVYSSAMYYHNSFMSV